MILNNLIMAGTDEPVHIRVTKDKISGVSSTAFIDTDDQITLSLEDALVFPGLINSHDHLDFNLFPRLGERIYGNYTEWGKYIHKHYKTQISAVLKVPPTLRYEWGVFKNLLCGVTTVVNHGEPSGLKDELITIFENMQALHSVGFESAWQLKLNNPLNVKLPVCIHVGEGDDWSSFSEIDRLTGWNLLRRKLVGVHGVAMTENQAKKFGAVVWCPQSNYFLLNKTAPVNLLEKHTDILFGTDSTLTGSWDIWEHLRVARGTRLLGEEELFYALNKNAANVWGLNTGKIEEGKEADIVVAHIKKGMRDYGAFFSLRPADLLLVIHKGEIRLFDENLVGQLPGLDLNNFSKVYINDAGKYVQGNLPGLMDRIKEYYAEAYFPVTANYSA